MQHKNSFTVTGQVITDPVKLQDRNVLEFKIIYKEKIKYKIFVSIDQHYDLALFAHTEIKKDTYIDVTGKLQLIPATANYPAYILIHAESIEIVLYQ
jgi:hypothetical protein